VLAGNSFTGGGALSANVTLALGTPGSLTGTSTNAVTTTSHTHAITVDLGAIAGTTAGPTITSSAGTNIVIPSASAAAAGIVTTGAQTFAGVKTFANPAIVGTILEDVFTITDGAAFEVDPDNGSIQLITLGASRTPKATNFAAGESITLMVNDGTAYTLTWTDATWGTGGVIWTGGIAPTLAISGYTVIQFWKVDTQVYGANVGNVA
jgi:hypothetical protein